jgi:hypothetical protein
VEPTRNWLVDILAKHGLARNIEYLGLKPDWINLRTISDIAKRLGFRMTARTWWPFPDSLVPQLGERNKFLRRAFCSSLAPVSLLTDPFFSSAR